MRDYVTFLFRVWRLSWQGSWKFYAWMTLLSVVSLVGLNAYAHQFAVATGHAGSARRGR